MQRLVIPFLVAGLLVGCGGRPGGASEPAATGTAASGAPLAPSSTTTGVPSASLADLDPAAFRGVVSAVCRDVRDRVPQVPDGDAAPAEIRAYVRAVDRSAVELATSLGRLADRRPSDARALRGMADAATGVARVGESTGGTIPDGLRTAIARFNERSSAARLPACGL